MLTIDVISDVICPWCFIGKRRLEKALDSRPATVRWHPFQLNPDMPREGIERKSYRIKKFGSWERSQELDAQAAAAGRPEGIMFNLDRQARTPNTLEAAPRHLADFRRRVLTLGYRCRHLRLRRQAHRSRSPSTRTSAGTRRVAPTMTRTVWPLCVLHHKMFDLGAFTVSEGVVLVSNQAHGTSGFS